MQWGSSKKNKDKQIKWALVIKDCEWIPEELSFDLEKIR